MIRHGFSYYELAEMDYAEIVYWAEALGEYYERLREDT
ncbi:hypothetical protein Calni_1923 [Calditerrivibrio nitroreducens DSM 19672]|uniref:Uncharacterized protein n=1 Tax=Calditerrivibrio nitroreducens (strain DSM 19672 / NBRC 101217 / Yu37-1) TaxID=768670 RepID=E4TH27_CALNY|nr:hypothetical protein Calni_1923 [Calditerrivibrio nitroreducens DSM 19672]